RTKAAVKEILDAGELKPFLVMAEELASAGSPIEVAAAAMLLIHRTQGGERPEQEIPSQSSRAPEPYRQQPRATPYPPGRHQAGDRPGRLIMRPGTRLPAGRTARSGGDPGMARLYVGAGRESGIRPGDLVGAIANEAKVSAGVIGAIEIEERFSIVDVPVEMAKGILEALSRTRIKGQKVPVRVFKD
ncbi:MAG: DbpA RNA binding domain-containing protein, partial [Nitrospira sp.]|nr:DbpA RNA binding domain-containing protein [Nitrospira sp.]